MVTRLNPYLNFETESRAALEFYHDALGGTLQIWTFGEYKMTDDPAYADLVMHGAVTSPDGLTIFASDVPPGGEPPVVGTSINVSLSSDDTDLTPIWDKLTEGAEIVVPFEIAPWGDRFGLFNDKFGVAWLVDQDGSL